MASDGATVAPSEDEPGGGNRGDLTIMEHLLELRNRFLVAAFAVVVGVLAVLFFTWDPPESLPNTFDILLRPARDRIDVSFEMVRDATALKVHENPEATARAILPEHAFREDIGVRTTASCWKSCARCCGGRRRASAPSPSTATTSPTS